MNQNENKNQEIREEELEKTAGGVVRPVIEVKYCGKCGMIMKLMNGKMTCVKCGFTGGIDF